MKKLYALLFTAASFTSIGQQITLDQTYSNDGQANVQPMTDNMIYYMSLKEMRSLDNDFTLSMHLYQDANTYLPSTEIRSQRVNGNSIDEATYYSWNSSDGDVEGYTMDPISDGIILGARLHENNQTTEIELAKLDGSLTAQGALDNTFGTNGKVVIPDFDFYPRPVKVLEHSDGSLYLISEVSISGSANKKIGITKLDASGTIDNTFGTNGHITEVIGDSIYNVKDAMIDADDNIYIAGGLYRYGSYSTGEGPGTFTSQRAFVAKFSANGTLDNTFANNGYRNFSFALPTRASQVNNIEFFSNGDVMVCGYITIPNGPNNFYTQLGFARILANGNMDTSFGPYNTGAISSNFSNNRATTREAIIENDVILGLGSVQESSSDPTLPAIFIMNGSGELITTGHPDGYYLYTNENDWMSQIASTPEGKILTYGEGYDQGSMLSQTSTYRFIYDAPANITEEGIELSVYPNPSSNVISIASPNAVDRVIIFGMDGKVARTYDNATNLSVEGIAQGSYILNAVLSSGEIVRKKIIIE
tara:strand:- start:9752 stop:11350 length:1599 start_codon:yes stop_codon:yes gene_type:complete